jgi:P27 family predicted phage terminase small subunit
MGERGPLPKKRGLESLQGNPGHRGTDDSYGPPLPGLPEKPIHFSERASEVWDWLCGVMEEMGTLSRSDVAIMTLYCDTMEKYEDCMKTGRGKDGVAVAANGSEYLSPHETRQAMINKQLDKYSAELGLTPGSRARLKVTCQKTDQVEDHTDELLSKRYGKNE